MEKEKRFRSFPGSKGEQVYLIDKFRTTLRPTHRKALAPKSVVYARYQINCTYTKIGLGIKAQNVGIAVLKHQIEVHGQRK